jgi:hypothetical protein
VAAAVKAIILVEALVVTLSAVAVVAVVSLELAAALLLVLEETLHLLKILFTM